MILYMHPENPQARAILQAVEILRKDGILVYPTDSSYAFCCMIGNQQGMERIRRIREVDDDHFFSLVCRDLSELATYAMVDNSQYRLLRAVLPGPYTFVLKGSKDIPKKLLTPKRKTIGLRVPDHQITKDLLEALGEPLLSTTVTLPNYSAEDLREIYQIEDLLEKRVDAIIDAGDCSHSPTTVIDLTSGVPEIIREGAGPIDIFI
ncbi:L-threonylcarbamoyladenylate synthase [Wohlfahrtiimonas populi]|uniref:L-threonylcarbamoyladenylate synthase n=1 Tax=Wohlfahrtiimonas populi TaxID=1940240 RepID=UPI00098D710D|nr:L-threonylcarbamoyladenylate synthase [Wohlfahrtiimonas populi]